MDIIIVDDLSPCTRVKKHPFYHVIHDLYYRCCDAVIVVSIDALIPVIDLMISMT